MSDLIPWYAPWSHRALIVLLALIGLGLMVRMVWCRRLAEGRICPGCGYDLRGIGDDVPCPECGDLPSRPGQRMRTRPSRWCLLPGLLLAVALPLFIVARHTQTHGASYWLRWGPGYWLFGQAHTRQRLGPFTLDWYSDRRTYGQERKLILRPGDIELTGYSIYMWEPVNDGEDITGDGKPDLLLREHKGGNSDGFALFEFDDGVIRKTLRLSGQPSFCEDIDGDGIWEYYTTTVSGSGHRPEHYRMQRLDRLVADPTNFEPWPQDWIDEAQE